MILDAKQKPPYLWYYCLVQSTGAIDIYPMSSAPSDKLRGKKSENHALAGFQIYPKFFGGVLSEAGSTIIRNNREAIFEDLIN